MPESNRGSVPVGGPKHGKVRDDPFVVLESSPTQGSSSGVFTDPLEGISKLGKSRSARVEPSSGGGRGFDDLDPLNSFGTPVRSFSPGRDKRGKEASPSRSSSPQSANSREQKGNSSFRYSESNTEKEIPVDNFQEPPCLTCKMLLQVDKSPTSEGQGQQYDDIWLTVSEVPLFTQPTAAPPPARPPPPIPHQTSKSGTGSFSSTKKGDEFSSRSNHSQHSQGPKPTRPAPKGPPVSQFDELEDFAMGRSANTVDESANLLSREETNPFSTAAASAAMKEAMEKAEAKFRHAKEVREREYAKAARNKESVQLERHEEDWQEREFTGTEARLESERKQKEEEERERRRLEREREKARQAVERANQEARERAAAQARERAVTEARLKAERVAVEKASAEARERAERVAMQRAQAEARERAAAEAKERAEKAAAEARERAAAAEAREKELKDKAAVARAEAEARRRAERAAVERAAAEARERAAAEARERAAAAAKTNQQRNDDDLESFFSMGRASSAPRGRANSTDPFFDQQFQNQGGSEAAKRASSSSGAPFNMKKASSTTNIVDDLSSIFGAVPSSGEFQEVEGETEERRRARLERHQRTQERARISETLDVEIKRWAAGKEGNLRALLSTLQYKSYSLYSSDKAKGATLQQKYIAEKVFDLLKFCRVCPHGEPGMPTVYLMSMAEIQVKQT
ncbi:Auxilin-related protein 2 [Sesamum angolense]|uniref:Auxilin-related protein 2 n=1 Tax=Sesamum angolense TaxID=2727404 RepID=A0AAE1XA83_9LAMI|nr:Auxilin-related protein 2 [Sesamum angolense]